jgi:hypothetical protein
MQPGINKIASRKKTINLNNAWPPCFRSLTILISAMAGRFPAVDQLPDISAREKDKRSE